MSGLPREIIRQLINEICQNIGGDWLLLGGSLLNFSGSSARGTHDIDVVLISDEHKSSAQSQRDLFTKAKALGLSPEQVNSSASFFLNQIPEWRKHLKVLQTGPLGKVFRPNLTLYALLKLARGSDVDIEDLKVAFDEFADDGFDDSYFYSCASEKAQKALTQHQLKILKKD